MSAAKDFSSESLTKNCTVIQNFVYMPSEYVIIIKYVCGECI